MSNWIPCYKDLMRGRKRALTRAARFVFLELCIEAREGDGLVELTPGLELAESVHDLLGGSRKEIAAAVPQLLAEEMLDATSRPGFLVITNWERWKLRDRTNAERQERYRERKRNASVTEQTVTPAVTEPVTKALRNGPRSDQIRSDQKRAAAKPSQDSKPRARAKTRAAVDRPTLPDADCPPQADAPTGSLPAEQPTTSPEQQHFQKNEQEEAEIRALREAERKARERLAAANGTPDPKPASGAFAGALASLGGKL